MLLMALKNKHNFTKCPSGTVCIFLGRITGRINSDTNKLQGFKGAQREPIQPQELHSYSHARFFLHEDKLSHRGPFVFVRLSERYMKTSASLHFLRKMLYICVTIHLMKVCICTLYILLNSS